MGNARTKASKKYNLKNYDRIEIFVPKGMKAVIKNLISPLSLNGYITGLIKKDMEEKGFDIF